MGNEEFDGSLSREEWQGRRAACRARMRPWVADRSRRAGRQVQNPVHDFLFEYYSYRPSHLLRWSPGAGVRLEAATEFDLDWRNWFHPCPGGWVLSAATFPRHRTPFLLWAIAYLAAKGSRPPELGCFGLHEWAMVYRDDQVRHRRVPMRLSRSETDRVVASAPLVCSHYDAFRFFSPAAAPLNALALRRATSGEHDQPGCVHVTMDLYKWAYVIAPYSSGDVIADAFELAIAAREVDMRASPYDLRALGLDPICIETRAGREEYVEAQRLLSQQAQPIRERLLAEYRRLERLLRDHATGHPQTSGAKSPMPAS